ncbi:unnamed protein product [Urochloa humidicola]
MTNGEELRNPTKTSMSFWVTLEVQKHGGILKNIVAAGEQLKHGIEMHIVMNNLIKMERNEY